MAWHIFPAHYVSHLEPTVTGDSEFDGAPMGNIRNPDPKITARFDTTTTLNVEFDRGGTTGAALNGMLLIANNFPREPGPGSRTYTVISATDSGFTASVTTLVNGVDSTTVDEFFPFDATSTQRYIRFSYDRSSSGTGMEVGVLSLGVTYQIASQGPVIATELLGGKIRRTFKGLTRASAETIIQHTTYNYIPDSTNTYRDGTGGRGSGNFIALIDDSTTPDTIYYGRAIVSINPYAAFYTELIVEMDQYREAVLI